MASVYKLYRPLPRNNTIENDVVLLKVLVPSSTAR